MDDIFNSFVWVYMGLVVLKYFLVICNIDHAVEESIKYGKSRSRLSSYFGIIFLGPIVILLTLPLALYIEKWSFFKVYSKADVTRQFQLKK